MSKPCTGTGEHRSGAPQARGRHLVWVKVFAWRGDDLHHERRVLDVFTLAEDVHGVLAGLSGPVADVAGAVALIVALDLGLRRTFHRKTWGGK